jgi:(p)ppGpp synthase/HD superfamily hydrolase
MQTLSKNLKTTTLGIDNPQIELAERIVLSAFAGKTDKAGEPYTEHLFRVAKNCGKFLPNQAFLNDTIIVALLHDLLEDCSNFWKQENLQALFGGSITTDVVKLTKNPKEEYEAYIDKIGAFSGGIVCKAVKLADLEDNMNLARLKRPLNEKDFERVKKYHKAFLILLS